MAEADGGGGKGGHLETVDLALSGDRAASPGKRAALELAEAAREDLHVRTTFAGSLFQGRVPWSLIHPMPAPSAAEAKEADAFLAKLAAVLREKVDAEKVDREGEIPEEARAALRAIGAFGIKIPKEYGGLGLSQHSYTRAAVLLGSHCASTTAFLSAHQSIGLPQPLKVFGTPEQKREYLPRLARGELSAFALTEEGAGSDPARMTTTATPTEDGKHFVIDGRKLWCTNGTVADLVVVVARTPPRVVDGRSHDQYTAFIVDARDPGVKVEHRCRFMGMNGLYNADMSFTKVKVPREAIIAGEGRGMKVALTTLNTGRLTLPAACLGVAKRCLDISRRWASTRVQWGAPIGKHAAVADMVARMAATVFAVESMTLLTSSLVDGGEADIRIEAAMCKMWGTEAAWGVVNDAVQIRGGRGYETAESLRARGQEGTPLERFLRDGRINTLFEGSSEILRLFIAREALDPHLRVAGAALNPKLPAGRRLRGLAGAAVHYAGWYPSTFLPGPIPAGMHPVLARHARSVERGSRRLARRLFHAMARRGPKLEKEQVLLGRFCEVGAELFAMAAACVRAQHLLAAGAKPESVVPVADLFCRGALLRIDARFRGISRNEDGAHYRFAQGVLEGGFTWLEELPGGGTTGAAGAE